MLHWKNHSKIVMFLFKKSFSKLRDCIVVYLYAFLHFIYTTPKMLMHISVDPS